ncbi:MAG: Uma2 family endonuclease [Planctomycetota bacterium]
MSIASTSMTTEQLLAIPEDGTDRELIRGELRERPMTKRNRHHARTEAKLARLLGNTLDENPTLGGDIYSGEVGVVLARDPDTTVGIDVAYFDQATVDRQSNSLTTMMEGVPRLAIEIMSPSDRIEDLQDKIEAYLDLKVEMVWLVDPRFRTIQVYRSDDLPIAYNVSQTIDLSPVMADQTLAVADVFA